MAWKQVALLSLASVLPLAQAETVLGVYIFHRHGDRTPKSLKPTHLTSLGAEEVFSSGEYYRNRYVAADAASRVVGLSPDIAVASQVDITAPSDAVLQNSAHVFAQALYPPVGGLSTEELANGSSVEAPMGGSQYLPISAVATAASSQDSENSAWLQGNSGCGKAMVSSNNYFASTEYAQTYRDSKAFYHDLLPVIQGTFTPDQASFKNGYTIFDLINVARIHNKTIPASDLLTDDAMWQLTHLANVHEWNLAFNETEPIRAISGAVLAGQVVQHLEAALKGQKAPLGIQFGAYASFSSFFGLAQLHKKSTDFMSIVDYASSMAFELVTNATVTEGAAPAADDVAVRFLFANGTAAERAPEPVALFGRDETVLPWPAFLAEMSKFAIADTRRWCTACGNTTGTCAPFAPGADAPGPASASDGRAGRAPLAPAVAGVIGALVALVVVLGVEALVYFLAGLRLVKKSTLARHAQAGAGDVYKA